MAEGTHADSPDQRERGAPDTALNVLWEPQRGPQTALVTCPIFEAVYGGARGGGKTDGVLGDWMIHASDYGRHARGLMVRRAREDLKDTIERAKELFLPLGAVWLVSDKEYRMPGGAILRMAYLENDQDAEHYQGHSYTRVYIEELTNFPNPAPVMKLKGTLRSAQGVPCFFRATCNPGGPGHLWVKMRYIDPAPMGYLPIPEVDERSGMTLHRVFIPAKLRDNPKLLENDPYYVARLAQTGSESLVKMWLDGDWNVIEGAYFDCWRSELHVITPFEIPPWWARFRAFDWGSAKPFSVGWYAIASEDFDGPSGRIPKGALVKYREWYGVRTNANGTFEPNVGLKLANLEIGKGILRREMPGEADQIKYSVADPSIFITSGAPSIAEQFSIGDKEGNYRVLWRRGDNRRTPKRGPISGWQQVRDRLIGEDGRPMLYFFGTCTHSIRTIPVLQHSLLDPEDVEKEGEDHAGDETRYACMSRPYAAPKPEAPKPITGMEALTMDRMWKEHSNTRRGRGRI